MRIRRSLRLTAALKAMLINRQSNFNGVVGILSKQAKSRFHCRRLQVAGLLCGLAGLVLGVLVWQPAMDAWVGSPDGLEDVGHPYVGKAMIALKP